ncbi:hypothetical protein B0H13DRAFT_2307192 [Mycena leptocephala]|nr:hypothetical protein B0H13DRAFT_2307192 [Mycena leptocephala]
MPPTIYNLSDLPTLDEIKQGSVNSLAKKDLLAIAIALKLLQPNEINNKNNTVTALKKAVLGALQTTSDTRFLKFTVHRPATTGGAAVKTSADKSKEDGAAQKKDLVPSGEDEEIDKPSGPAPPAGNILHHTEGEVSTLSIKVSFSGVGTGSRDVWILPSQRDAITVFKGADGKYTTSLKNLVPAALVQFSPVKGERYYKLSIIGSSGYPYTLGTMDQFLTGQFHENLELAEANTCTLRLDASGTREVLICDLVLEAKGSDNVAVIQPAMKPLEIAQGRAMSQVKKKKTKGKTTFDSDEEEDWPNALNDKPFQKFLCGILDGKIEGYTELKTIGEMRERYLTLTRAVKFLENWKSTTRGIPWRVPEDYKDDSDETVRQYANRPFNKAVVESALDIKKTIASRDREVFENPDLPYDPRLKKWAEDDGEDMDDKHKRKYAAMTRRQFFEHLEDCKKTRLAEDADRANERSKAKGKRRRSPDEDADVSDAGTSSELDSETEKLLQRALKKARKMKRAKDGQGLAGPSHRRKARLTSNELDTPVYRMSLIPLCKVTLLTPLTVLTAHYLCYIPAQLVLSLLSTVVT